MIPCPRSILDTRCSFSLQCHILLKFFPVVCCRVAFTVLKLECKSGFLTVESKDRS